MQVRKTGSASNETRSKPASIDAYNRYMGGMDKTSQVSSQLFQTLIEHFKKKT